MRDTAKLRAKHRKVFGISIGLAVLLHAAVFLLSPTFRVGQMGSLDSGRDSDNPGPIREPRVFTVLFGPPTIIDQDGQRWPETSDRFLEAVRVTELPLECADQGAVHIGEHHGSVRLTVNERGYAAAVEMIESSGSPCGDRLLRSTAGALRYHWLPDDRFAAPIDLVQPLTLTEGSG